MKSSVNASHSFYVTAVAAEEIPVQHMPRIFLHMMQHSLGLKAPVR